MAAIPNRSGPTPENRRKAFEFADSWAKQISALSTATIVLSATFLKDILPEGSSVDHAWALYTSWILLLVAAVLGLAVLGALTAHLTRGGDEPDVYAASIRVTSLSQLGAFFVGIGMFALFAGLNL